MQMNPRRGLKRCNESNENLIGYHKITRIARHMADAHGPLPMDTLVLLDRLQQMVRVEAELRGFDVTCAWSIAA